MVVHSYAANQEPAYLLTQLLTMTTTDKFPSLERGVAELGAGHDALPGLHEVDVAAQRVDLAVVGNVP